MIQLVPHNPAWEDKFEEEADLIRSVLEDEIIDIQHIGSSAIPAILSEPIIDIAVLIAQEEYLQAYTTTLARIGYKYFPEHSSVERLFFRKGDPVEFHLSLTQEGKTTYWHRQLLFRDYLNSHLEAAKEYEALKQKLLTENVDYFQGKTEFIKNILKLAEQEH